MKPSDFKVPQLKEILRRKGLATAGVKSEVPLGEWMQTTFLSTDEGHEQSGAMQDDATQNEEMADIEIPSDRDLLVRERQLLERELRLRDREIEMLRSSLRPAPDTTETQSRSIVKTISGLLAEFSGEEDTFSNWEKQVNLLCSTYSLDDRASRILIGTRLKGQALKWFQSRPEHIELETPQLLQAMKKIFKRRENKVVLRRKFEERTWKPGEAFSHYYHDKIILGNRVALAEDELVEYLINGIPEKHMRNQARIQQFESTADLLEAFEEVALDGGKNRPHRETPSSSKPEARENRTPAAQEKTTAAKEVNTEWPKTARCYNCSKYGHLAKDCTAAKREKGACFKCGEMGHVISECKSRTGAKQVNCVENSIKGEDEFQKDIIVEIGRAKKKTKLKLRVRLDTGSRISFIKGKFVHRTFMRKYDDKSYCGLNNSSLVKLGEVRVSMQLNGRVENDLVLYVVPNATMIAPAVIGRDILKKYGLSLTSSSTVTEKDAISEILNIDTCETESKITEALQINSEIPQDKQLYLKSMFTTEYLEPVRPEVPKVQTQLKIIVKDLKPFNFAACRLS